MKRTTKKFYYIYDKETGEVYKDNLTWKQMRYWRKFSKRWGYKIKVKSFKI